MDHCRVDLSLSFAKAADEEERRRDGEMRTRKREDNEKKPLGTDPPQATKKDMKRRGNPASFFLCFSFFPSLPSLSNFFLFLERGSREKERERGREREPRRERERDWARHFKRKNSPRFFVLSPPQFSFPAPLSSKTYYKTRVVSRRCSR